MIQSDDDVDGMLAEAAALDARFCAAVAEAAPACRDPAVLLNLCRAIETLAEDLSQLSLEELLSVHRSLSGFRHRVEKSIAHAR